MLWAALQTKSMMEVGLHTGKWICTQESRQPCAKVHCGGDMTKETGSCDMGLTCDVRKPQWKCPCLMILIGEVLLCSSSKAACLVCCAHWEEQEWENLSGKWQTNCCLAGYWKPWLLEGVGVTETSPVSLMGKQDWKLCATHRHCPRGGGNFGGVLSTEHELLILLFSASVLFCVMPPMSMCWQLWCYVKHHATSLSISPHCGERVGCSPEQLEKLLPWTFKLLILAALSTSFFLNHIRIPCAFFLFYFQLNPWLSWKFSS